MRLKILTQILSKVNAYVPDDRIITTHFYNKYPYKCDKHRHIVSAGDYIEHEYSLTYSQWRKAVKAYFRAVYLELADGRDYYFPLYMLGSLKIRKFRMGIDRAKSMWGKKTKLYRYGYYVYWSDRKFKFADYWAIRVSVEIKQTIADYLKYVPDGIFKFVDSEKPKASWSYDERKTAKVVRKDGTKTIKRCKTYCQ
jgi:hypothetical protein